MSFSEGSCHGNLRRSGAWLQPRAPSTLQIHNDCCLWGRGTPTADLPSVAASLPAHTWATRVHVGRQQARLGAVAHCCVLSLEV